MSDDGVIRVIHPGVSVWDNENKIHCIFHHYTGHPGRRGKWASTESPRYPGGRNGAKWRREQEGDPSARAGEAIWKGFIYEQNVISNAQVTPERDTAGVATGHHHIIGLDPGGAVQNAGIFWVNRPSPVWEHPEYGPVPILPNGQWVAYAEVYKADIPTQEYKLRLYREAMFYLKLSDFENFNEVVTDVFGDPSGHQEWVNFSDPKLSCPIRVSTGHPKLDHALNARVEGIKHVNALFGLQKVCCGIQVYGRHVACERCGHVMPSIPGAVIMERCQNLIWELQIAVKPKMRRPIDQAKDGKVEGSIPQHLCDASRYALVGGATVVGELRAQDERRLDEARRAAGALTLSNAMADWLDQQNALPVGNEDLSSGAGDPFA